MSEVSFNPFPGLRAFEQDEDFLFFGREKQIDDLLIKLRTQRFIAVVGSSGSGKSSLVKCGLLPSLHGGYMAKAGSRWKVALCRPGDDPIGNLARALAEPGIMHDNPELESTGASMITATLRRSNLGLVEAVKQSDLKPADNLLIVVDQFEELFRFSKYERTQYSGRRDSISFVELLLNASRQEGVSIYIVLTMRSDFIGECTAFPGLPELINKGQYLVPRMSREEQRDAIAGPIAVGGATVSPRLLTHLLNDVGDNPDQLPILQHALLRTWSYWKQHQGTDSPIDLDHYRAIGTMAEALSQHAEEAYGELKTDKQRKICETLFKAITEKGEERQGIRRPTKLREICEIANATSEEVVAVIEVFRKEGRSFLMPPADVPLNDESIIDISHESLMRIWQRLIRWVSDETQSAEIYRRLAEAAGLFQEAKSGLWRNPELQFALNWYDETRPNRHWAQRYDPSFERAIGFLKESKRQDEFEALQQHTREKMKIRRMRFFAIILGTAAIVSILMLIVIVVQKGEVVTAKSETTHAQQETRSAKEEEQKALDKAKRALADAEAASREANRSRQEEKKALDQARISLEVAEATKAEADKFKDSAEVYQRSAIQERANAGKALREANTNRAQAIKLRMLALGQSLAIQSLREHSNGNLELGALLALQAHLFNVNNGGNPFDPDIYRALSQSGDPRTIYRGHNAGVRCIKILADGKEIVSGSDDKTVRIWNTVMPGDQRELVNPAGQAIRSIAVYGSQYVAAGDIAGNIVVWDRSEKDNAVVIKAHKGIVSALLFSDASHIISGGADGFIRITNLAQPAGQTALSDKINSRITSLSLSADGKLAVASEEEKVRIFNIRAPGTSPVVLDVKGSRIMTVAFSPDGKLLATGAANGAVSLWNVATSQRVTSLTGHTSATTGIVFSPDGHVLATVSLDGSVRLWDTRSPDLEPIVLQEHGGWLWSIDFSADGHTVISAGEDKVIRSWVPDSDRLARILCGKVSRGLTSEEWRTYVGEGVGNERPCGQ